MSRQERGQTDGVFRRMRDDLHRKARKLGGAEMAPAVQVIEAVIDTAIAQGQSREATEGYLASGAVAVRAGTFEHEAQTARADGPMAAAACRDGCAFCCVLSGEDGGVITAHEAQDLHAALAPLVGQPDGRMWHPRACPALDPATQRCRAYQVRPVICRSYFSTDVAACEAVVDGKEGAGTAVLGSYPRYLSIHALVRQLIGVAKAPTYSLARVAAAAVEGKSLAASLKMAKHAPSVLRGERERTRPDGR